MPARAHAIRLLLTAASLLAPLGQAHAASADPAASQGPRIVAVLDPVDLNTQRADSVWGGFLRRRFAASPAWKVVERDSMRAKAKDFGLYAYRNCHEFQCAFDAGNIFSAEYVLFSSLTRLGGAYAYTLNLVHVPGSQTVWSRVGQAGPGETGEPGVSLGNAWTYLISRLAPDKARPGREKLGQVTVLDLSLGRWAPSQAVAERVAAHLYAARAFDIMGSKEQDELVGALGIDKSAFLPTDSAVYALGGKMGVSHLVSSRLIEDRDHAFRLELGFYDIAGHRMVKTDRSASARDMVDVLRFETKFFSALFPIEPDGEVGFEASRAAVASHRFRLSWAAGAAGIAAGAACGFLAYRADRASQRKYGQIGDSRSREAATELRGEAAVQERRSRIWGAAGLAGLLAGGAFLVFSF